jgi:hypothetical protein
MRNIIKLSVIVLVLMTAGSLSLNAQKGKRGSKADTTMMPMHRMGRMPMAPGMSGQDSVRRGRMNRGPGSMWMPMMPPGMGHMWGMQRPFSHGWWPGMGMWGQGPWGRMWPGMSGEFGYAHGPGMAMLDRIPNLTDKQKKEISDLRQKQKEETEKLRSDVQKQMQDMRDSHRKAIMNVLTDEQKKWLEENRPGGIIPSESPKAPKPPDTPVM